MSIILEWNKKKLQQETISIVEKSFFFQKVSPRQSSSRQNLSKPYKMASCANSPPLWNLVIDNFQPWFKYCIFDLHHTAKKQFQIFCWKIFFSHNFWPDLKTSYICVQYTKIKILSTVDRLVWKCPQKLPSS